MSTNKKSYMSQGYDALVKNQHMVLMVFAVIFILIALVGLIALWGAQTGSSNTSGVGSLVMSSTAEDGTMTPTTEVVAEFLIVMFTVLGVAMLAYVMTVDRCVKKLMTKDQIYAAILVAGSKNLTDEEAKNAEKDQLMKMVTDLGLPSQTIPAGLAAIKSGASQGMNTTSRMVTNTGRRMQGAMQGWNDAPIKSASGKTMKKQSPKDEDEEEDDDNT